MRLEGKALILILVLTSFSFATSFIFKNYHLSDNESLAVGGNIINIKDIQVPTYDIGGECKQKQGGTVTFLVIKSVRENPPYVSEYHLTEGENITLYAYDRAVPYAGNARTGVFTLIAYDIYANELTSDCNPLNETITFKADFDDEYRYCSEPDASSIYTATITTTGTLKPKQLAPWRVSAVRDDPSGFFNDTCADNKTVLEYSCAGGYDDIKPTAVSSLIGCPDDKICDSGRCISKDRKVSEQPPPLIIPQKTYEQPQKLELLLVARELIQQIKNDIYVVSSAGRNVTEITAKLRIAEEAFNNENYQDAIVAAERAKVLLEQTANETTNKTPDLNQTKDQTTNQTEMRDNQTPEKQIEQIIIKSENNNWVMNLMVILLVAILIINIYFLIKRKK